MTESGDVASAAPGWALVFPGQGSQRPGMGLPWVDHPAWAVVPVIAAVTGRDVAGLLLRADAGWLRRTDAAQLAAFALEMVALGALRLERPDVLADVVGCAGHSLGEYAALVAAGILDVVEAARLVHARGTAMLQAVAGQPGTMGVLVAEAAARAETLVRDANRLGHDVWIANVNSPQQVVLSGTTAGIEAVEAAARPARLLRLPVAGAFHSPLMEPARPALSAAWRDVTLHAARFPVVANADATAHDGAADWRALGARQLTGQVRWQESLGELNRLGGNHFLELGPGRVLGSTIRQTLPEIPAWSVERPGALAGLPVAAAALAVP